MAKALTKTFIAGHRGMVGSAILRECRRAGDSELLVRGREELDLTRQSEVERFFKSENIGRVYLAAARVGGILANRDYPAEFIYQNLAIQTNVIHAAHESGVERLLFLGSSCIYPRMASQPMSEDALLTGELESSNEPYAVAKIAGIRMCESYHRQYGNDFRSVMPTNLYGPNDNFDLQSSHVLPALLARFHHASKNRLPEVTVWGSGTPRREFLHVDDMARACRLVMDMDAETFWARVPEHNSHINIGCGEDVSIAELAQLIAGITGYRGKIVYDSSKPDGTPRKLLDVQRIRSLGWKPEISLQDGVRDTYEWMVENASHSGESKTG